MPTVTPTTPNPEPNSPEEQQSWGVAPAEHAEFDLTALTPRPHTHDWVAQGNYVHCNTGGHGIPYNHVTEQFMGADSAGKPIFKPISTADADARVTEYAAREQKLDKKND
jgi:hypothetical protein